MTSARFEELLEIACSQPKVAEWVKRGHDESLWWPLSVSDQRTRMLIAGLSTRISYRMVSTYREVVDALSSLSWSSIAAMDPADFRVLVKKLGLTDTRERYWSSLVSFLDGCSAGEVVLPELSNDELILRIAESVDGASYKVAQCCVLYARGYYCGVIPVDSGMKDLLLPCMGLPSGTTAVAHDVLRLQLEALTRDTDCYGVALRNGYGGLAIPEALPLTWWVHLVLIYFKRFYCNEKRWETCPLASAGAGCMCRAGSAEPGGTRIVLLEGLDGTGKSLLAKNLKRWGFRTTHIGYNPENETKDLEDLYARVFTESPTQRKCLDRSFLSEYVYGETLRGLSRLDQPSVIELLNTANERGAIVIYMSASKTTCLDRRPGDDRDLLSTHYEALMATYDEVLEWTADVLPVIRFDTDHDHAESMLERLGLVRGVTDGQT